MFAESVHEIIHILNSFRNVTEIYVQEVTLVSNPVSGGLKINLTHVQSYHVVFQDWIERPQVRTAQWVVRPMPIDIDVAS